MEAQPSVTNAPRLPELIMPHGSFCKRKCKFLVYFKGGDCDCALFYYAIANLRKFLADIPRWHSVPRLLARVQRQLAGLRALARRHQQAPAAHLL